MQATGAMNRNATLDIAKGLGILAVVFGHNEIVLHEKGELFRILFSFHMPLFFFISGVFLKEGTSFRNFVTAKSETLLKPFFVVMTVVCIIRLISAGLEEHAVSSGHLAAFAKLFYGTGATIPWIPLWFLPHLFVSSLFALLLIKIFRNDRERYIPAVALALLGTGYFVMKFLAANDLPVFGHPIKAGTGLPWSIDLIPATSPFLLLGFCLRNRVRTFAFWLPGFLSATAIFSGLHLCFNETIDFNQRLYGEFFIATAQALSGIYLTLSLAAILEKSAPCRNILAYIGAGSLFILIFHFYIQKDSFDFLSVIMPGLYPAASTSFFLACALPLLIREAVRRNALLRILLFPAKQ